MCCSKSKVEWIEQGGEINKLTVINSCIFARVDMIPSVLHYYTTVFPLLICASKLIEVDCCIYFSIYSSSLNT